MSDRIIGNKQPRIKFLDGLPNIRSGKLGDMIVTNESGQTYLGIKTKDEWKVATLASPGGIKNLTIDSLDVRSSTFLRGSLQLRGDIRTPADIYLRNSKIYFDSSETTPNDYITGGANNLQFYANGIEQLELTTTEAQVAQTLVLSSDIKLPTTKKLYLDGGGGTNDTYITESSGNVFDLYVGTGLGGSNNMIKASASQVTVQTAMNLESVTSSFPVLTLKNTTADATAPYLKLLSQRGTTAVDAVDGDYLGFIQFNGYDDGTPNTQTYSQIAGRIGDSGSDSEEGSLTFSVAANDGTLNAGLTLAGNSSAARTDATLSGTLTINTINTDTAGDNYLVEVSGEVKKRTPAEVLSDIGAGTSSVGALNDLSDVTYSSGDLTIASLDTIISGALTFDSSGDITLNADGGNIFFKDASTDLAEIDGKGIRSHVGPIFMAEIADAATDTVNQGQLWVHDDDPNNLMFTDGDGEDMHISINTAVWGGYFPRLTGADGEWLCIPFGYQGAYLSLGTNAAAPDTSYNPATTADDLGAVIWQSIHGIRVINCRIWYGQGGATNTRHILCLMRYDIDTAGTLANGVEVAGVDNDLGSDDYTTLAFTDLTMTSDVRVTNAQVLIAMVYCSDAINAAFTAKCIIEYQDIV